MVSLESHIEEQQGNQHSDQRFEVVGRAAVHNADQQTQQNNVNETFRILAVINRPDTRD
jgi:hypothetical protein